MTPEAQRIAIAEACGWANTIYLKPGDGYYGQHPIWGTTEPVPDYLSDLNAIHEAEEVLKKQRKLSWYYDELENVLNLETRDIACADAPQRAEAFLRTLGLWKED